MKSSSKGAEFSPGDLVSHFRESGNAGTVVRVERRGLFRRQLVYFVQWRENVDPVPIRYGLWHVSEPHWQNLEETHAQETVPEQREVSPTNDTYSTTGR